MSQFTNEEPTPMSHIFIHNQMAQSHNVEMEKESSCKAATNSSFYGCHWPNIHLSKVFKKSCHFLQMSSNGKVSGQWVFKF